MTREEAIAELNTFKIGAKSELGENALDMAIQALEQEPCNDAISRQAAKKALEDRFMELQKRHSENKYETNFCLNTILELPFVTPQPKIGWWIPRNSFLLQYKCSECGWESEKYNYCPNCGAKMEVGK